MYGRGRILLLAVAALMPAACSELAPMAPEQGEEVAMQFAGSSSAGAPSVELNQVLATLRRVTAKYHDLNVAIEDGFVLLHPCEERPGEGPVGTVYVHFGRLLDGVIDPELPDALVYEPSRNGRPKLVAAEFAEPYGADPNPPTFMGQTFQREDEFGVWALHVWVWRPNPEGMFAEANPRVSCEAES